MRDYSKGKIYKLVAGDMTYYGSTTRRLCQRIGCHRADYKKEKLSSYSKMLFDSGYEVLIFLVENYPCNSKEELLSRERWYIENNECVNKARPIRTYEESLSYQKEYNKQHKDKYDAYAVEYREKNKDYYKQYRETHKEYYKQYRERNKERMREYKANYDLNKKIDKMFS